MPRGSHRWARFALPTLVGDLRKTTPWDYGSRLCATLVRDDGRIFPDSIFKQPLIPLSSSGSTGRSSIPETSVHEPIGRSVLDRPPSRAMTRRTGYTPAFSRRISPELCIMPSPPEIQRAQGRPGGRCTRGPRARKIARGALTSGTGGYTPAFPAQWFTAYFALSSVNQLLPPSPSQDLWSLSTTWRLHGRARTTRLRRPC